VWNFDKFLGQFLEAYDSVSVNFFCSDRKRTILFAELCHHYLEKHAPQARLSSPQGVSILSAKSTVQDMKTRYPEYKAQIEDGKPRNMRKMKITREYFKRWIAESPLAQTTANEVNALLNSFQNNTLNIYFTHENIIGAYLYHKLNVPAEKTLIGFAHHVTVSPGNVYVRF
jgi:broad specificity phosphatase PhoE